MVSTSSNKVASINKVENPTLGDLLRCTREDIGLSRAKVAQKTGINENSLAKYEKAGQKGGQFPSAPKLAILCAVLEIDPAFALFYSLDEEQSDAFGSQLLRHAIIDSGLDMAVELFTPGLKIDRHEMMMAIVKETMSLREEVQELRQATKQSGSDNSPSRSDVSSNNQEAVGAASTKNLKETNNGSDC